MIFSGLKSIERIDLSLNTISEIQNGTFDNLSTLRVLELGFNQIKIINSIFNGVENLKALFLAQNQIESIEDEFTRLTQLKLLDLSYNGITILDSNVFSKLERLESLELHGCNLSEIDANLFKQQTNLEILDLSENHLSTLNLTIFNSLNKLGFLKLEANEIEELNDYIHIKAIMPSLKFINLARNFIDCDTIMEMIQYFKNNTIDYELGQEVDVGCRLLPFDSRALQVYRLSNAQIIENEKKLNE